MAKTEEKKQLVNVVVTRIEGESKNYAKFGTLAKVAEIGNKPVVLTGNDGTVYLAKSLVNGTKAVRITITEE